MSRLTKLVLTSSVVATVTAGTVLYHQSGKKSYTQWRADSGSVSSHTTVPSTAPPLPTSPEAPATGLQMSLKPSVSTVPPSVAQGSFHVHQAMTIQQGGTNILVLGFKVRNGFNSPVDLQTVGPIPQGLTVTLDNSTMSVSVMAAVDAPLGSYSLPIIVQGTGGGLNDAAKIWVVVTQ